MVDRPELDKLLAAAKQHKMTDAEFAEQRASWVRGEMGMGETNVVLHRPAVAVRRCRWCGDLDDYHAGDCGSFFSEELHRTRFEDDAS